MRIVFALALKAGIGPIDHPFGQGVGGRPGLKQRVVVLRVDGGWRQRQYTAVFIANEEVFTGVPFFYPSNAFSGPWLPGGDTSGVRCHQQRGFGR